MSDCEYCDSATVCTSCQTGYGLNSTGDGCVGMYPEVLCTKKKSHRLSSTVSD